MKVKDLLNTCMSFLIINIYENEESKKILETSSIKNISDEILSKTVQEWYMSNGNIEIYV